MGTALLTIFCSKMILFEIICIFELNMIISGTPEDLFLNIISKNDENLTKKIAYTQRLVAEAVSVEVDARGRSFFG